MKTRIILFILFAFVALSTKSQNTQLSDEFNRICSFYDWQDVNTVEQWNANHLEVADFDQTNADQLTLMPWTTSWYQNYRSNLLFKELTGDFVFTTNVTVTNRAGSGLPSSAYSLSGAMIRAATGVTQANWTIGLENYIFLAIGRGTSGSTFQFERKSTTNSSSSLNLSAISGNEATIRFVRIDNAVIVLLQLPGGNFSVIHRYNRPDLPPTLQVGLVAYTDYFKVNTYGADTSFYNSNVINPSLNPDPGIPARAMNPDVIGRFDFARYEDVNLPPAYQGLDFVDASQVSNAEILTLFGYNSTPTSETGWKIWRGTNSDWTDPINWSGSTLPSSQDSILIPNCGCVEVVYPTITSGSHTYQALKIELGGQLSVDSGATFITNMLSPHSKFINQGTIFNHGVIQLINTKDNQIDNTGVIECLNSGQLNILK